MLMLKQKQNVLTAFLRQILLQSYCRFSSSCRRRKLPYIAIPGNEFITLLNEKTGSSYDIKIMKVITTSTPIGPWKPVKARSGEKI